MVMTLTFFENGLLELVSGIATLSLDAGMEVVTYMLLHVQPCSPAHCIGTVHPMSHHFLCCSITITAFHSLFIAWESSFTK